MPRRVPELNRKKKGKVDRLLSVMEGRLPVPISKTSQEREGLVNGSPVKSHYRPATRRLLRRMNRRLPVKAQPLPLTSFTKMRLVVIDKPRGWWSIRARATRRIPG